MKKSFKVLIFIIGSLLVSSIFVGSTVQAATNGGGGVGDLSTCWANVKVDNVRYDPVTQRHIVAIGMRFSTTLIVNYRTLMNFRMELGKFFGETTVAKLSRNCLLA